MDSDHYTVLGLDLGAQSVGWALLEYQRQGKEDLPARILAMGSRIFEAGVEGDLESGQEESRAVERRESRLRRRQAERRSRRMENLACLLRRHGLFPSGKVRSGAHRHELLAQLDKTIYEQRRNESAEGKLDALRQLPYYLRAKALDEKLTPLELGRAFYHLAQRRGYLSNRKALKKENDDSGVVEKDIHALIEKMAAAGMRTLGEYLASIDPFEEERLRKRWTARSMYLHEFEEIWKAQQPHHPKLLNDSFKRDLHECIFYQRPLKSQKRLVGPCDLIREKKRAPRALLCAQRFRYLQRLNDTLVIFPNGDERPFTEEERAILIPLFEQQEKVTWGGIRKALKDLKKDKVEFNFERGGEKDLQGNTTNARLLKHFGPLWETFDAASKEAIVGEVMGILQPESLAKRGEHWGLDKAAAADFGAKTHLEAGYFHLSREAIKQLLPLMEQGVQYRTAVDEVFGDQWARQATLRVPPVVDALPTLRNPVVMRTLTETRKVVNSVLESYGKPRYIRIELARELKKGAKERKELSKMNRKRRTEREKIRDRITQETGNPRPSRRDIEKVLLWEECSELCPYTGQHISFSSLLSPESPWDIEHIIPFSRCLDDSFLNKTLCYHEENRHVKKNQTPWEAYEPQPDKYAAILQRVEDFKGDARNAKIKRFRAEDLEDFEGFTSRKLNDTRYASKLAAQLLSWLYGEEARKHIQASTGQVTAYLRGAWRLNQILNDGGDNEKLRTDHRHHAVDALAIALTDRRMVKRLADAARDQQLKKGRIAGFMKRFGRDLPWESFLDDAYAAVDAITVSHRVSRKVSGNLHDDTIYSAPLEDDKGKPYVKIRKPLSESFTAKDIDKVIDPEIRRILHGWLEDHGGDAKAAFGNPENPPYVYVHNQDSPRAKIPIRRVKLKEYRQVTEIGEGHRSRHVWARANNHIEIFALKDKEGEVKKWVGRVVSKLEAYKRRKAKEPIVNRNWDEQHDFLFSLTQGDTIEVDGNDNEDSKHLYKVYTVANQLACRHITDARLKKEIPLKPTDKEPIKYLFVPYAATLLKRNCQKVSISPLGEIHVAHD